MVTYTSAICYDTTVKVINFTPANPSLVKTPNGCIGDSLRISVTGDAGSTFNWYKNITDTKPFFVGKNYTIANVTKSDTFVELLETKFFPNEKLVSFCGIETQDI